MSSIFVKNRRKKEIERRAGMGRNREKRKGIRGLCQHQAHTDQTQPLPNTMHGTGVADEGVHEHGGSEKGAV